MAFAQSMKKGQIPIGCQLCESGAKIQWKCIDCSLLMCSKCKDKVHSKFKNAVDHKIIGIQEVGQFEDSSETLKFSDVKCKQHEGQACCMFCKTCKQLICLKCIAKIHNGHNFTDEEEYMVEKGELQDGLKKAQENVDELIDEENELDQQKRVNHTEYTRAKGEILAQKNALIKVVDQYAGKFINDLDQKWENVTQSVDGRKNEVRQAKKQIEEQMSAAEETLNSNDFATFFQNNKKIGTFLLRKSALISKPVISMLKFMPGEIAESTFGVFQSPESSNKVRKINMNILNCYTTDMNRIHYMAICLDNSIWIGQNLSGQLHHIKTKADRIQILARLNFIPYGIATTTSNDLLLSLRDPSRLQKIINGKVDLENSIISVDPLIITAVHITRDHKVLIGARGGEKTFPATGKRVIIAMEMNGNCKAEFEYDRNNEQLFTFCFRITSTTRGNMAVIDSFNEDRTGRVVILDPHGKLINIYNGNHEINTDHPFSPIALATTSSDNVIIIDKYSHALPIINCDGQPLTCYNAQDIGIQHPFTLAVSSKEHLFIGCNDPEIDSQKLYELEFSGF